MQKVCAKLSCYQHRHQLALQRNESWVRSVMLLWPVHMSVNLDRCFIDQQNKMNDAQIQTQVRMGLNAVIRDKSVTNYNCIINKRKQRHGFSILSHLWVLLHLWYDTIFCWCLTSFPHRRSGGISSQSELTNETNMQFRKWLPYLWTVIVVSEMTPR